MGIFEYIDFITPYIILIFLVAIANLIAWAKNEEIIFNKLFKILMTLIGATIIVYIALNIKEERKEAGIKKHSIIMDNIKEAQKLNEQKRENKE